jgi:predicted RNase H-like HicB family nuclease
MPKILGYIIVTFNVQHEKDDIWTAHCEELGTATFGHSEKEAIEKLQEAVEAHLNTLEDVGERERFFRENDIKFYTYKPKPKKIKITVTASLNKEIHVKSHIQPLLELQPA